MTKIFSSLKNFILEDYATRYYLLTALLLTVSIVLNYQFEIEDELIDNQSSKSIRLLFYLSLYGFAYYGTLFLLMLTKGKNYFSSKELLLKSSLAILVLAVDGTYSVTTGFFKHFFQSSMPEATFLRKIANQALPLSGYFLVLLLLHIHYDRTTKSLYGLNFRGFHGKPYLAMFGIMIPLIAWASFQQDFTLQYPMFKYWNYTPVFGLTQLQMFGLYECFYLLDFINIELVFRGLLVIGMVKLMGKDALLPMVVVYAFLHFGKPVAETISSVFGGYILGVLAYRTQSIMGGFLIHMGIAFLMDLFAILQMNFTI